MAHDISGFPVPDIQTSTEALKDVMESEEGRVMADGLKRKMEELSELYKTMTPEERARFESKFAEKFQKSLDNLKRVVHEKVEKSSSTTATMTPTVYSQWPVVLLAIAVLVGVIGYVAYRLIKYVEKKEEPKMTRQERMKAQKAEKKLAKKTSPPSSPKSTSSTANGAAKKRSKAA